MGEYLHECLKQSLLTRLSLSSVTFTPNANPVIQARANSVNAIIPDAILRSMALQPGGLDAAFDAPNGVLSATTAVYVRRIVVLP